MSITVISGCPGSGKTTLARALAEQKSSGIHLVTDEFYHFLAHRLDPSIPESKPQNTAVVRAFAHAAQSFAEDGYDVFVDGVIGPWWLDTLTPIFGQFNYVLLQASLATVLERTRERAKTTQASADSALVTVMQGQFAAIEHYQPHRVTTDTRPPTQLLEAVAHDLSLGNYLFRSN